MFKESRMTNCNLTTAGSEETNGKVSLDMLAKMTGFPVEMIKEELFSGEEATQVSLEDLRSAMLTYIDSTMLMDNQK